MLTSIAMLILAIALPFTPSSTIIDRFGLLFSPNQICIFGYLPRAFRLPQR